MNYEIRNCQNCKSEFRIEPEDFMFYEKIKVPPPTFCPECRFQRRLMFKNERTLYKRKCDLCRKDMVSVFAPDKPYKVFCNPCWWSDKWDASEFAMEFDPSQNFFKQLHKLQQKVPHMNLIVTYPTLINSEYVNHADNLKNCYLTFDASFCDNVHYSKTTVRDKDSMDCNMVGESELCYEAIDVGRAARIFYTEACEDSHNIYFSKNLMWCNDCVGCVNLTNKKYCIFNEPYTPEEYHKKFKELRLDTFSGLQKIQEEVSKFFIKYPVKFAHARYNVNSTGEYVFNSRNARNMYQARLVEDSKFCQFISMAPVKDCYDYTEWGRGAQRIYETVTAGESVDAVRFSVACWSSVMDVEYSMYSIASSHILGSIGVRNKKFCILNKQYSEEEFRGLREKIIAGMNTNPYIDSQGRIFRYGEFFPYDLSLFDYNETTAADYFPLRKDEVLEHGWRWREQAPPEYKATMKGGAIPDSIRDVADLITQEILECVVCKGAYRIVSQELQLLRRFDLPVPRKCPVCRYKERLGRINSPCLYRGKCHCVGKKSENGIYQNLANHFHGSAPCPNEFETSYAFDRPEIVYCEQCYQSEVV